MVLYCFNSRSWHWTKLKRWWHLELGFCNGAFVDALNSPLSQKLLWHLRCGVEFSTEVKASFAISESHVSHVLLWLLHQTNMLH
jgi:hypothetical protein